MNKKLRKQLDVIQEMLKEEGGDRLWDVLSALRGPDNADLGSLTKNETTSYIRAAAFPKLLDSCRPIMTIAGGAWTAKKGRISDKFLVSCKAEYHFVFHVGIAARILEIIDYDHWNYKQ